MEKSVVAVEEEIKSLEALIAEVESKLSTVEGAADVSLYEEHGRLKKELDNAMWQWAEQSESLEKIKNKN